MVNSKFFNSEKSSKRTFLTALFLVFASIISCCVFSGTTQAYYKKDHNVGCYAIAYTKFFTYTQQGELYSESGVHSTNQVCATLKEDGTVDGDLRQQNPPSDYRPIEGRIGNNYSPKLTVSGKKVSIEYCTDSDMPNQCTNSRQTKDFTYNGGSFLDFVSEIQNFIKDKTKVATNYTLQALSENTNKEEAKKQAIEETNKQREEKDKCSDVTSLGWIICPIITGIADGLKVAYDTLIEPLLYVEPELFTANTSSEGNSVFAAWQIFQNFANIALIILIIVVIFSQLTGVGIDNYGIKKALPKIIVAAILINLSYIICQLLVDVSNILGYALRAMFDNLTSQVINNTTAEGAILGQLGTTAASVGIIVVMANVLVYTPAGLGFIAMTAANLPIIVAALIIAVVSVIFFFILLGVRKAGVVLLVAIAPLAFACYILPNTKKLFFDKWVKAFKGLILLFPICGFIMGGASFASAILLSVGGDGFGDAIIALLINVVPFFFIPSALRSSMVGLGNIGNKISGFGQRMGRRFGGAASRGIKASDRYNAALANRRLRFNQAKVDSLQNRRNRLETRLAEQEANRTGRSVEDIKNDEDFQKLIQERFGDTRTGALAAAALKAGEDQTKIDNAKSIVNREGGAVGYLEAMAAGAENKQLEQQISDATVMLKRNNIFDNNEKLRDKLKTTTNQAEAHAIARQLASSSSGANTLAEAINAGAFANNGTAQAAIRRAVADSSKMKATDTALFKAMKDDNWSSFFGEGALSNFRNDEGVINSLKNNYIGEMSKASFRGVFGENNAQITDERIIKMAQEIKSDPIAWNGLKAEYKTRIDQIVGQNAIKNTSQTITQNGTVVGGSNPASGQLNIRHGPTLAGGSTTVSAPAPTSIQERRSVVNENPTVEERTVVGGRRSTRTVEQGQTYNTTTPAGQFNSADIRAAVQEGVRTGMQGARNDIRNAVQEGVRSGAQGFNQLLNEDYEGKHFKEEPSSNEDYEEKHLREDYKPKR